MIDTYLKSKEKAALDGLRAFLVNVIEPQQGRAAVPETTDADGNAIPAQPAAGDPAYWYTCVRCSFAIPSFADIEACDPAEGEAVCGVWA